MNANKRNIAMNGCNRQHGACMTSLDWGLLSAEPKRDCRCFDTVDAGGCSVLAAALLQIESFGTCNGQTMAAASAFNQFINYSERF